MAPSTQLAGKEVADRFRYLLRALLREASYLPDAQARVHFKHHIITHFRKYSPRHHHFRYQPVELVEPYRHKYPESWRKKIARQQRVYVQDEIAPGRREIPELLRVCRQQLHRLERANQGYRPDLLHVLNMAYGRKGARRHWLLQPLLTLDVPTDHQTQDIVADQLARLPGMPHGYAASIPTIPPAVRHLLRSQRAAQPPSDKRKARGNPTSFMHPAFKETNLWNKPTPVRVAKNKAIAHYTSGLYSALPPVPTAEWEALRQLSHGEKPWPGPVPRRTPANSNAPVRYIDDGLSLAYDRPLHTTHKEQPHNLTSRYMRRLYEAVFRQCCKMEHSSKDEAPIFHWGTPKSTLHPRSSFVAPPTKPKKTKRNVAVS